MSIAKLRLSTLMFGVMAASYQQAHAGVSPAGAFVTSVPIEVPPFRGLEPHISLEYSSDGGNGFAGVGVQLAATSTVTRASAGRGAPYYSAAGDIFLLDGAELVPCPTSGGISPSCKYPAASPAGLIAYFARREDYRRIAYEPPRTGGGDIWHVWSKNGVKAIYAWQDKTSAGAFRWRLTSLRDTLGNTVTYQHVVDATTSDPATSYLDRITYNGNSIVFYREPRPDAIQLAVGSSGLEKITRRLKLIDVLVGSSRARSYKLSYGSPSTESARSLLRSVQQFGSDVQVDPAGTITNENSATRLPPVRFDPAAPGVPGDFVSDVRQPSPTSIPAAPSLWTGLLSATSQGAGRILSKDRQRCYVADVDGDAKSENVCFIGYEPHGVVDYYHYHLYTTFMKPDGSGIERETMQEASSAAPLVYFPDSSFIEKARDLGTYFGDINGDRKTDFYTLEQHTYCDEASRFVCSCTPHDGTPCQHVMIRTYTSLGNGFFVLGKTGDEGTWRHRDDWGFAIDLGDINGDRLTDLVFAPVHMNADSNGPYEDIQIFSALGRADGSDTSYTLGIPTTTGWHIEWPVGSIMSSTANLGRLLLGDVNGDGLDDVTQLWYSPAHCIESWCFAHAHAYTALSQGDSFRALSSPAEMADYYWDYRTPLLPRNTCTNWASYISADADGDGRSDILIPGFDMTVGGATNGADTTLHTYLSRGDGSYTTVPVQVLKGVPYQACSVVMPSWHISEEVGVTVGPFFVKHHSEGDRNETTVGLQFSETIAEFYGERRNNAHFREYPPQGAGGTDINGDGIADLVNVEQDKISDTASVIRLQTMLGDGSGRFSVGPSINPNWTLEYDEVPSVAFGDINRDGVVEIYYSERTKNLSGGAQSGTSFAVAGHVRSGLDTMNWRAGGDFNGDGKGDLAYFRGPAIGLRALYRDDVAPSGWRDFIGNPGWGDHAPGAPADAALRYANLTFQWPDIHNWRLMDVNADGRTDLVFVRYGAGGADELEVYTLLARPGSTDGFLVTYQGGIFAGQGLKNPRDWMPADVDGDGRGDLVKVEPYTDDFAIGMLIRVLTSRGDGTWVSSSSIADLGSFDLNLTRSTKVADVNADGKSDLVWVQSLPAGGVIAHTMVSAPWYIGRWRVVASPVHFAVTGLEVPSKWHAGDVNADGAADLVYLKSEDLPSGRVFYHYTLLSTGGGLWREASGIELGNALPHAPEWTLADVNLDGRNDLVAWGETGVFTKLARGDGSFAVAVVSPQVALGTSSNRRHWKVADVQGTGKPQLLYTGFDAGNLFVRTLAPRINGDMVTTATRSLGATTSITYAPSSSQARITDPASGCLLPAGQVRHLVSSETVRDGRLGGGSSTLTYGYECPRWSYQERRFLGWEYQTITSEAVANRPKSTTWLHSGLTDACGSQALESRLLDAGGGVLSGSTHTYVSPGVAPPFHCEELDRMGSTCNSGAACMETWQSFRYDEFGNLTHAYDYGLKNATVAQGDVERLTLQAPVANTADYIVDRNAYVARFDNASTLGRLMSFTNFCYDADPVRLDETALCQTAPQKGLLTSEKHWNDQTGELPPTAYGYDAFGNRTQTTDPNGGRTTVTYDPTYNIFPQTGCNALNQCATTYWNDVLGVPAYVVDVNGYWQDKRTYDPLGRVIAVTRRDCSVAYTSYQNWDNPSLRYIEEDFPNSPTDRLWTRNYVDGLGRTYRVEKEGDAPGVTFAQEQIYSDASATPWRISLWYTTSGNPRYSVTTYDAAGRVVNIGHPDDTALRPSRVQATYGNDTWTTWAVVIDELGHEKKTVSDAHGRTVEVLEQNGTSTYLTRYAYDVLGRLTRVTDHAGNVTTISLDSLGRRLVLNDPDRAVTVDEYDKVGNLLFETDARGVRLGLLYDALNRVTRKVYPDGSEIRYAYDSAGPGAASTDLIGRLAFVSDPSAADCPDGVAERYRYTALGQLVETTKCVGAISHTLAMTYDAMGRVDSTLYPDGERVDYAYDPAGRLYSVSGYVGSMTYDAAGHLTQTVLANGVTEGWTYNSDREWLESALVTRAGAALYQASYTYQLDGLVEISSSDTDATYSHYAYDGLHRLTQVTGDQAQTLTYDALGNVLDNTAIGVYAYDDPAHKHAATQAGTRTYHYDAVGNMTARAAGTTPELSVTWDFDSRPIAIVNAAGQTVEYRYDHAGSRVSEYGGGQLTNYFGPLLEWSWNLGLTKYYYAGQRLVARRQSGATHFYHQDRLGSTRLMTNASGLEEARFGFAAYGETSIQTGSTDTDIRFTGHRNAKNTGGAGYHDLIYMNARFYDPRLARFISADTIVPDPGEPQALNRYSYAYNNPISNVDPTGHDPESAEDDPTPGEILAAMDEVMPDLLNQHADYLDLADQLTNGAGYEPSPGLEPRTMQEAGHVALSLTGSLLPDLADSGLALINELGRKPGKCLLNVHHAIARSNLRVDIGMLGSAYRAAAVLAADTANFEEITERFPSRADLLNLPRNAITVWDRNPFHLWQGEAHGHIGISDGKGNDISSTSRPMKNMKWYGYIKAQGYETGYRVFMPK